MLYFQQMKGSCRHFCFVTVNFQNEQEMNNRDQNIGSKLLSARFLAPMILGVNYGHDCVGAFNWNRCFPW